MKFILAIIYAAIIFTGCNTAETTPTPLLWHIQSPTGQTAYLFGSIHAGNETLFPLPDYVMVPFMQADYLAVELDIRDFSQLNYESQQFLLELIQDLNIGTIYDDIGETLFYELQNAVTENIPTFRLLDKSATSHEILLHFTHLERLHRSHITSYRMEQGVDSYFLNLASSRNIPVIEIESAATRNTIFINRPSEMVAYEIKQIIHRLETNTFFQYDSWGNPVDIDIYINATDRWQRGVVSEIAESRRYPLRNIDNVSAEGAAVKHWVANAHNMRSHAMATRLMELMADDKNVFAVTGVAHLAGEGSIAYWLRHYGYTLTRV